MNKEDIKMAYVAGIFDGDGSIGLAKLKTSSVNPVYCPTLQLSNQSVDMMNFMLENFGGDVTALKLHVCLNGNPGNQTYRWRLRSAKNVGPFLEKLVNFLKIKQERGKTLLEFIKSFTFTPGKTTSIETLEAKERYYLKMVEFNSWTSFHNTITNKIARENTKDPIFWSYVAGLMDTDGSFSVKKQNRNKGTHVINPRHSPVISLSMSDTRGINYLRQNCFLGKLCIPMNSSCTNGFHYQFAMYGKNECIEFLTNIIPHLKSKTENAKILLEFCNRFEVTKYCRKGVSKEELAFREDCYRRLIHANKYGVSKSSLIDLKFLPGNAGDNKGQAAKACSLNVASEKTSLEEDAVL